MRKIIAILLLAVIGAGTWQGWKAWNKRSLSQHALRTAVLPAVESVPCPVWFPSQDGMNLSEEAATRPKTDDPGLRLRGVIEALHRGPAKASSLRLFPDDSSPHGVFLSADGTAYIDYPKSLFERPMGLREEFLFIRALGKTLLRNCPDVKSFVLLVDGAPRDFISLHMPAHGKYILPASQQKK